MILNNSGTARAYGCLSTSFSRLERDMRRRGAFFPPPLGSNACALSKEPAGPTLKEKE